ncbi:MbcA/ParS/Xre antitoxin family protein [Pseudomonas sp. RTB3]|uniref:MbcA/ParS/Xre antitoxin family protein n=1 Tax=unclassified Pseudomonas TaxID=196821 RepID=UPI002B22DCF4|nr:MULTISPECIES: MbcA/ParS/Xre antitoxin family protein [unclassified Pseudomonas]MEB0008554.1 MbcA/ParS/Xre antitoxin family protein [Pseudomonas sp. RTB2]MEB0020048.1 MbcA/ParS/Xre antitoxin family protein [Pseudomonas sp. RTB3]MEB0272453.1 MbcA/ParS/Xre antitoxin family protein [Pseudomonas sp. 5B4]
MQDLDLLWQKAEQVFGDKAKEAVLLSTHRRQFDGMTAIDFVKDQQNLQRVIKVLTQIEHGMPAEVEVANEQIQGSGGIVSAHFAGQGTWHSSL